MTPDLETAVRVAVAALGGAAVGIERQWSGHASGRFAHLGGVRTFTLLGAAAGISGVLWESTYTGLAAILLSGAVALVVLGYAAVSRREIDATTEVAAMVVISAGVLGGLGHLALASGVIAVTALLLIEKSRLHSVVRRLDDVELRAGARFAVMAVVVMPLLPAGPYGPLGGVRPRELWALVLVLSALSFLGYVARRAVGPRQGTVLAGALGGVVSSTSVALGFARESRSRAGESTSLALGAIAASTVMFGRLGLVTAALDLDLGRRLAPLLVAPLLGGALVLGAGLIRPKRPHARTGDLLGNPLEIVAAVKLAILFQLVSFAIHAARAAFGDAGVLWSAALVGLTDTDALALSMARMTPESIPLDVRAAAIAVGASSNTLLKLLIVSTIGGSAFRARAGLGLALLTILAGASSWAALSGFGSQP